MDYNVQIDFQLLGTTILPKEISRITGIDPEVELIKGERNEKLGLPKLNIWSIRSHAKSNELVDHWRDLAITLENSKDSIKDIAKTGTAKFTLIVNSSERIPSLIIPPEMSSFAGFVGAVIDIDHYAA
jgi:hypothetical protein